MISRNPLKTNNMMLYENESLFIKAKRNYSAARVKRLKSTTVSSLKNLFRRPLAMF